MRKIFVLLSAAVTLLLEALFPIQCLACGAQGPDICDRCVRGLKPAKRQRYEWLLSLGNYRDPGIRKIVWHIKRQPNRRAAAIIGRTFSERIGNRPRDPDQWTFVPIPITRKRFRERGYNQCELLARALGRIFGIPVMARCLRKTRNTPKQGMSKSREKRRENIRGSFAVTDADAVTGRNVILVDDVTTTGSTLAEARGVLLAAGAARVLAWTVAN